MSDPDSGTSEPRGPAALGADFIIPALAGGLTIYYLASTVDLIWEAKATGTVIGFALLALCIAQCARLGLRIASGRGSFSFGDLVRNDEFNRQRFSLAAMVTLYIVTIYWVGATIGLFFLLVGSMWLLGVKKVRTLVGVAFLSTAIAHLALITLLGSKLPRGVILDLVAAMAGGAAA
jgi:hypothetical protein